MNDKGAKRISVIGAGFAGMTVALRLAQKGFQVDLYESSSRVGGLLGTDKTNFGIAEKAANALICTERSMSLFSELQLTPSIPLDSARKRFLFREKPKTWPLRLSETIQMILKVIPRFLKGRKSFVPQDGETLEQWGFRNIGSAATKYILGPAMQGVYGNEITGLSATLILGPLFSKKKRNGKYRGLLTGPGGMQDLVDKLHSKLLAEGVSIHLNSNINPQEIKTPIVVATSARSASWLLDKVHPEMAIELKKIKMSSLMSVTLFFEKGQKSYKGFGCLIPRGYDLKTLGILMNSYIFKDRDKTYNETWMIGGVSDGKLLDLSDEKLLEFIIQERTRILGQKDSVLDFRINRWKDALPYYDLNLEQAIKNLNQLEAAKENGIYLHGNYLGGIGLSKILERSESLAEKISSDLLSK
ncbi:MAG: protoporphyrinogen/coproporphyrinogen oxidase [Bdellovibrio sp.]